MIITKINVSEKLGMDNNPDNQFINPNKKPEDDNPPPPPDDTQDSSPVQPPQPGQQFQQSSEQPTSDVAYSPAKAPKPKKKWLKTLIALLVIAVLIGLGWLLYKEVTKEDQTAQAPAAQSKDIDQMDVGLLSPDYGNLYPDVPISNSYNALVNVQMFEGLVRYEDKSKIVPLLATDWTNPDDKTWVFNIKSGVKFHDGNELQAEDVKYSIDKIIKSESDFAAIFAGTIASVKAVNDNQVQIKTSAPDPTLLNKLAFLYVIDNDLPKDSEPSQAGTGPYQIKPGTKPTETNVQMVAYDGYHGDKPTTKAVNFGSAKDEKSLIKGYQDGKFDIIGPVSEPEAQNVADATRFITNEPEVTYFGFNTTKGPLKNKKVREAIRYAVDPIKLGEAHGDTLTPLSQLVPESIPGYNPALPTYEKDIAKAKKLLAQAGYEDGVTIELTTSDAGNVPEELTKELKAVGITLKTNEAEDFGKFIDYFLAGKAEMYYISYASDTLDGADMYQSVVSSSASYSNESLDKKLDEASKTVDPAKRLKLLQDVAVIVDEDIPIVPLGTRDSLWLMNKDYDITQDMPSSLLSVYFYKTQLK